MDNVYNVKLRSGEELIAAVVDEVEKDERMYILFESPVQVSSTPDGVFARDWLYFSKTDKIWIAAAEIMFLNECSNYAVEYYTNFQKRLREKDEDEAYSALNYTDEEIEEANDLISAYLDSCNITKH